MLRLLISCMALAGLASASIPLTKTVKKEFVKLHNDIRMTNPSPVAKMKWSRALAKYAAKVTDQCKFQHDPAKKYKDNVYADYARVDDHMQLASAAVTFWTTSISECVATCDDKHNVVAKDNTAVGCAITNCPDQALTLVMCEYGNADSLPKNKKGKKGKKGGKKGKKGRKGRKGRKKGRKGRKKNKEPRDLTIDEILGNLN